MKQLFACILVCAFAFPLSAQTVRINILSKHLRLVREGKTPHITIYIPKGGRVYDKLSRKTINTNRLRLMYRSSWVCEAGAVLDSFDLTVTGDGKTCAEIILPDGKRSYPLPLHIISGANPIITTQEEIYRYSADSAYAELAPPNDGTYEAFAALSHVILARTKERIKNKKSDFDFCDLTVDQVYKGRLAPQKWTIENDSWFIDTARLKGELLFHANSGGRTFGEMVFGSSGGYTGIEDRLYRFALILGKDSSAFWRQTIDRDELASLVFPGKNFATAEELLAASQKLAPENMRLAVNRVKGWNYLKSNNYTVTVSGSEITFSGYGLGHNCGLSQKGAMLLSARGYSRYEILQHYYPEIIFKRQGALQYPYTLSYALFDMRDGQIIYSSSPAFINRLITPGSIMKLVTALYVLNKPSYASYRYTCTGKSDNPYMPDKCWKPYGHGDIDFTKALSSSCNLFIASLYDYIDYSDYRAYYTKLSSAINIAEPLPLSVTDSEECRIYTGLDFGLTLSVLNIIDIYRLTQPDTAFTNEALGIYNRLTPETRMYLKNTLMQTFRTGTASLPVTQSGDPNNYLPLTTDATFKGILNAPDDCTGKTSSMTDGTNVPTGYGIFVGNLYNTGVIVVLRNGTGHHAALWGKVLLKSESRR